MNIPKESKKFLELKKEDFVESPIWQFEEEKQYVFPVYDLPVKSLEDRLVGKEVTLANGASIWAMMYFLDIENAIKNLHFRIILVDTNSGWFELARYFDSHYKLNGPQYLCRELGLKIEEVFPLRYDLSGIVEGDAEILNGIVNAYIENPLSFEEILELLGS